MHLRRLRFLTAILPLPALLLAAGPPSAERGRQIYVEGRSPSGGEITAVMSDAGVEVPASAVPCASCHGRDGKGRPEGGVAPTDLTWANLTKPYGITHPSGRKHPPYDARLLKRAISLGIDPAGNALHVAMPRFRMSLQDMEDLVAHLQQLGREANPGVGDSSLAVGVLLPPASDLGRAIQAVLTARFDELNRRGGVYGRRIEPRFLETPGPPEQRRAWTADFLEREQIFAGVSCFLAGADGELASLFQQKEIPLIGPFTLHPRESVPPDRYVFYLLSGIEAEGQALVRFAGSRSEVKPQAAILAPADGELDAAVTAVTQAAAKAGWPPPLAIRLQRGSAPGELQRLAEAKAGPLFFLGSGPEAAALLQALDRLRWHPHFFATAAAADGSLFGAPQAFDGRIFLALPTSPRGPDPDAASAYHALAVAARLPADNVSAQLSALAAAEVLIEGLQRCGRDISREKLVEELEKLRSFRTGYAPPVTYGPNRRLGARGAYVVRLDLQGKRFEDQGVWIEVE
ncbi:MAG TPA: ABC transporter substrate-binding protein [Thermoanaerobaculia bacterium]|nr:ABC transporter substrate-binding protein [Thermoanaerobaculia bacterium]